MPETPSGSSGSLRVGIVGCGFIGNAHSWALWALRKSGTIDVSVVATSDRDAERAEALAKPNKARVLEVEELIEAVDVVFVCTPTAIHLEVVEAAASSGRPVFCEKPLGTGLEDALRVAAALERVPHQVGLVLRAAPVFDSMGEALSSGRYGGPLVAALRDDQFFPIQGHYASRWRADVEAAGGGTLIEHSIHDLDLFRVLLGEPAQVTCTTASNFGHRGIEDLAVASFTFPSGVVANLVSVWHQVLTRPSSRRLEVFCEDAMLWTDDDNLGPLHIETPKGAEVIEPPVPEWVEKIPAPPEVRRPLGLYGEASRRFLVALQDGRPPSPGATEALTAHRMVDAAYRSASSGLPVASPGSTGGP
jgi:predicted dehydrogenase